MILTRSPLTHPQKGRPVRLACVKHAASVRPEPGSNSPKKPITQATPRTQETQAPQEPAPPRQTKQPSTPQTPPTRRAQNTPSKKTRQTKQHKNKTHYRDLKQHTQRRRPPCPQGQDEQHLASAWSTLAEHLGSSKRKPSDLGLNKLGRPAADPPCRAWNPSGPRAATADN